MNKQASCTVCDKQFTYNPASHKGLYCSKICRYKDHSNIVKSGYTQKLKEKKAQLALANWKGNVIRKEKLSKIMKGRIVGKQTREKISSNKLKNDFLIAKKEIVKQRGSKCERCGKQLQGKDLIIHHINGEQWKNNHDNLMILCRSDHSKIHNKISQISGVFSGKATVQNYISKILKELGIDLKHPDFIETPNRVARVYSEMFEGVKQGEKQINDILTKWFPSDANQMVVFHNKIFSMCPHHLLPVEYEAYTAYIPNGRAIGLSKIARVTELLARKPILQENLTVEINKQIMKHLKPKGVATMLKGRHFCMVMRGVKQANSNVITSDLQGIFKTDSSAKEEFINFTKIIN